MLNYTQIDRHPFTTLAKAVKTPGHHCSWCGSRFREPQVEGCKNCGGPWE